MKTLIKRIWHFYAAPPLFSARRFVGAAVVLLLAYAVVHVAGFREYTSIVCGTLPTGSGGATPALALGCIYIAFYLGAMVLAPVLLIAGALFFGLETLLLRRPGRRPR